MGLPERLEGRGRVGERVSGPGDSHHRELRHLLGHRQHLADRVGGTEPLGDHAGPALVRAVVLPVAVVALDVARRRHGDVHPGEVLIIPANVPHEAEMIGDVEEMDVFTPLREDFLEEHI